MNLTRRILALALPVVVSNMSQLAMGLVDSAFVGRYVGKAALAGVGVGDMYTWTLWCFFFGTLSAVNTWSAQHLGAEQPEESRRYGWQGIWLALAAGLLLFAVTPLLIRVLVVARPDPDVLAPALEYGSIRSAGAVFPLLTAAVAAHLQGIGDTRTPMLVALGANALNVLLDWVLILGKFGIAARGVRGAAEATVIATAVGALFSFAIFWRRAGRQGPRFFGVERSRLLNVLKQGAQTGFTWLAEAGSWLCFYVIVARISADAGALNQAVVRLLQISFLPAVGASVALQTLVGQCCGAGDHALAARVHTTALRLAWIYMGTIALVYLLLYRPLLSVFVTDPALVASARPVLLLAAAFQLFDAMGIMASGSLRGAGDTRFPLLWMLLCSYVLFVPALLVVVQQFGGGLTGAWTVGTINICLFGVGVQWRWLRGGWRAIRLVQPAADRDAGVRAI